MSFRIGKRVYDLADTDGLTTAHRPDETSTVLARERRDGSYVLWTWPTLREARQFAVRLAWDNRPAKFAFFETIERGRVCYGIEVLKGGR